MKVTATATGQVPVILGDDSTRDYIDGLLPRQDRSIQEVELFRSPFGVFYNRANHKNKFEWSVERDHGTAEEAFAFLLDHPDKVPDTADIKFEHKNNVRYLKGATLAGPECTKHIGKATVFKYVVMGGALTKI